MPPILKTGEPDPYLFLLQRIDARQEEMGADIKSVQHELSDGRVRFENHEGRLRALEAPRPTPSAEPSTGRAERKAGGPLAERLSVGATVKIIAAVGALAGVFIAGMRIG